MPIYEYRCRKCRRRVSVLSRSFDAANIRPKCTYCGHDALDRLVSCVAVLRSEGAQLDDLSDSSALGDLDENDPRSMGRWMKKMSSETGEDLGDEFREVADRLEAGQSPEDIESSMPDLAPPTPTDSP